MPHIGDKVRQVVQSLGLCQVPASILEPTAYLGNVPPVLLQPRIEPSLLSCPVLSTSLDLFSAGRMGEVPKYLQSWSTLMSFHKSPGQETLTLDSTFQALWGL